MAALALLAAATLTLYWTTLSYEFVSWDDHLHLRDNPFFGPPWLANLARLWQAPFERLYNPLAYSWWAVLAHVDTLFGTAGRGLNASLFHAGNLALQVANVWLAWRLLRCLGCGIGGATWGAALFLVHPLAVESVAWVSEARGLLAATLLLSALNGYIAYIEADRARRASQEPAPRRAICLALYLLALLLFGLALLAKSSAAAGPLLAAVLSWGWLGRSARQTALELAPWGVLVVGIAWISSREQSYEAMHHAVPLLMRPIVAADALAFYLYKLVWPEALGIDYGRTPFRVVESGVGYITMWAPVAVAVAVWLSRRRWLAIGAALFVAALAPVLGMIPFQYQDYSTVADRYAYLALLGPVWCVAWWADGLAKSAKAASRRKLAATVGVLIWLALAWRTHQQSQVWRNDLELFTHAEQVNPHSAAALGNLGRYWFEQGELAQAEGYFESAARHFPNKLTSQLNLSVLRLRQNRLAEAQQRAELACETSPQSVKAQLQRAAVLARRHDWPAAALAAQRVLQLDPQDEVAGDIDALARFAQGAALPEADRAGLAERHQQLAEQRLLEQDVSAALFHAEWAAKLSDQPDTWLALARTQRLAGDRQAAARTCRQAVERFPGHAESHNDLGALLAAEDPQQARLHYQQALQLKPNFAHAHNNLGILEARAGDWKSAAGHFRRAVALQPSLESAANNLRNAEQNLRRAASQDVGR